MKYHKNKNIINYHTIIKYKCVQNVKWHLKYELVLIYSIMISISVRYLLINGVYQH